MPQAILEYTQTLRDDDRDDGGPDLGPGRSRSANLRPLAIVLQSTHDTGVANWLGYKMCDAAAPGSRIT